MAKQAANNTRPNADSLNHASFLLSGVTWQDSLLQAYRNYMVVSQSIFIAVSIVLFSSQFSASTAQNKLVFVIPFFMISFLGLATLKFLTNAIAERAKSVDWWQKRLLRHEVSYSINRHYSTFCVVKEHKFSPPNVEAHSLTDEEIEKLLRIETPKARRVFGWFVPGFYLLWVVLIGITALTFPWKELFF